MTKRKNLSLLLNELHIIILCGVLIGAFTYEFMKHELPCPLCLLQRIGMTAMALGPLLNILYGFRPIHYALSMAGALFSASVSIRQILLHICKGFPEYGLPVFGLELYTWAFLVAFSSLIGTTLLLFLYDSSDEYRASEKIRILGYIAISLLVALVVINGVFAFFECGLNFCPDDPKLYVY